MQTFESWGQFWVLTGAVVGVSATVAALINTLATKALKRHKISNCNIHAEDMQTIQATNRVMLRCHDVTLQVLDKLARQEPTNGEIPAQREELQAFLRDELTKKRRANDSR